MTEQPKTNRTQLTDLPVAEQEMTAEEMENVLGGKTHKETRQNNTKTDTAPPISAAIAKELPTVTPKNQTPL